MEDNPFCEGKLPYYWVEDLRLKVSITPEVAGGHSPRGTARMKKGQMRIRLQSWTGQKSY